MLAVDEELVATHDRATTLLQRLMTEFGILTLSEETIAIQKLVIAKRPVPGSSPRIFYADAICDPSRSGAFSRPALR